MLIATQIVENASSGLDDAMERTHGIDANHVEMCRFVDLNDQGYIDVRRALQRYVVQAQTSLGDDEQS